MSWLSEFLGAKRKKKKAETSEKETTSPTDEEDGETNLSSIIDMFAGGKQEAMPMQNLNTMAIKFLLSKFLGAK